MQDPNMDAVQPRDNRQRNIIIAVVAGSLVLCCCCLFLVAAYTYGDQAMQLLNEFSRTVPAIPAL